MSEQKPNRIELIRSPDDPGVADLQDDFAAVSGAVFAADPHPSIAMFVMDNADAHMWMTGAWEFAKPYTGAIIGALGGWLVARAGRKVRLRIGEIEAEASSIQEVRELLNIVDERSSPEV